MLKIDSYGFGKMVIDGKKYSSDLIIFGDGRIIDSWWRQEGHLLSIDDLKEVIEYKPKLLVVGIGAYGVMKVSQETRDFLAKIGIPIIVERTKEAVEKFNAHKSKDVVGAFHLTC